MTSANLDIQNLRKGTMARVLETICVKFDQNRPNHLGEEPSQTDRETDKHTDRYTDNLVHPQSV